MKIFARLQTQTNQVFSLQFWKFMIFFFTFYLESCGSAKPSIYNFTEQELKQWLTKHGFKAFNSEQIWKWLYQKRDVDSFTDMSDLSLATRSSLNEHFLLESMV